MSTAAAVTRALRAYIPHPVTLRTTSRDGKLIITVPDSPIGRHALHLAHVVSWATDQPHQLVDCRRHHRGSPKLQLTFAPAGPATSQPQPIQEDPWDTYQATLHRYTQLGLGRSNP